MPPHCDSLDGPVVRAAQRVLQIRRTNAISREVADRYFFETAVRVHRAGEGASFTGLKPAGLDVGPIIPVAENAIESGNAAPLEDALVAAVREELAHRFHAPPRPHGGGDRRARKLSCIAPLKWHRFRCRCRSR